MGYQNFEKDEVQSKLPPALLIGRVIYAFENFNDGEGALEFVKNNDFDSLCKELPCVEFSVNLIKELFEKHCLKGGKLDDDMFYSKRGDEIKQYYIDLSFDGVDEDVYNNLADGLSTGFMSDENEESILWNIIKEYHDAILLNTITHFDSSDEETNYKIKYNTAEWLSSLLPIELMETDGLGKLIAPIDEFMSTFSFRMGKYYDSYGLYELDNETKNFMKDKRKAIFDENGIKTREDLQDYLKNLLEEYPLLKNGNDDFKNTLSKVLSIHEEDQDVVYDTSGYLAGSDGYLDI